MADDEDGDAFRQAIDLELSRREEELRCLEELRHGISFAPRRSLMRTPPASFSVTAEAIPPIREECMPPAPATPPVQSAKRPLTSPQEAQGPTRRKMAAREDAAPPISGIQTAPPVSQLVSLDSPSADSPPEASSTPEKHGLAACSSVNLIDQVYTAVKGISGVANAANKLNMNDKGLISGFGQDILAVVAALNLRLAEAEHQVTAMKLKVATIELQQASAAATGTVSAARPGTVRLASGAGLNGRKEYAAILKLPSGNAEMAVEQRGPAVLFYPNSEDIKSSEATLNELRSKVQPGQNGIQVQGVRRVGNAGVVVQTASTAAAEKLKAAAPATLRAADPKSRRPLVALRNLSGNPNAEEVLEDLHRVNLAEDADWPLEKVRKEASFAFKKGRLGGRSTTIVYEVSAALREKLVGLGKVYVGWDAVDVCDYVRVTCCSRCQQYGHPEKHCRATGMTCGKCGDSGHKAEECQAVFQCCATCKRFKRPEAGSHRTAAIDCPARLYAERTAVNMISYG